MALDTVSNFVDSLRHVRLLEPEQQNALARELLTRFAEPKALADELIRRGWLTPYQANLLLQGRGGELMLGSYVLLELLGEGGMGQVFKAKNWKLGCIVALKLIRKERLANEDAVRRFHREIRAAAQLSHPNIVMAYDADEVNGTHFFAMECVEGSDLAKLIKQHGPMPVAQACDWIRQAALGLQHAHERGMVHRDIKPHNLLLTKQGVVKILDMGLARLTVAGEDGDISTTMTQEGAVMGTPDYIAPEQAEESHTVDIRADLYSLGCTLYQLLAGKVPFPGGTLIQKLKKHQSNQPTPIEMCRSDVPPAVCAVVYKLMAKRPEERYQTPAELVRALETLPAADGQTLPGDAGQGVHTGPVDPTFDEVLDFRPTDTAAEAMRAEQRVRRRAEKRTLRLAAAGGSILVLGLAAALWLFLRPTDRPQPPSQPISVEQPKPREQDKRAFEQWLRDVAAMPAEEQVKAVVAELQKRNPGFDGKVKYQIRDGTVTLLDARSNDITDLAPIRALSGLKTLYVGGNMYPARSKLADLTPLKGMSLVELRCGDSSVSDLEPLKGMPLLTLACNHSNVSDLSPLRGMRLTTLMCNAKKVTDLSPLKVMRLTYFSCEDTQVADMSVLKGMPLVVFACRGSQVADLSPLRDSPLEVIWCDFQPYRDAQILRSIKTLKQINGKPVAEFWKEVDAQQAAFEAWCQQVAAMPAKQQVQAVAAELMKRNPGFDGKVDHKTEGDAVAGVRFVSDAVTDLTPLRALPKLTSVGCRGSKATGGNGIGKLTDLSPLKGLPLRWLFCDCTAVADLTPLRGMPLENFSCGECPVHDFSPLQDVPLKWFVCYQTTIADLSILKGKQGFHTLICHHTSVHDLSPLTGLPLSYLDCRSTDIADLAPLKGAPLKVLLCDPKPLRDTMILRSSKTLETINGKPAVEFWKEVGALPKP